MKFCSAGAFRKNRALPLFFAIMVLPSVHIFSPACHAFNLKDAFNSALTDSPEMYRAKEKKKNAHFQKGVSILNILSPTASFQMSKEVSKDTPLGGGDIAPLGSLSEYKRKTIGKISLVPSLTTIFEKEYLLQSSKYGVEAQERLVFIAVAEIYNKVFFNREKLRLQESLVDRYREILRVEKLSLEHGQSTKSNVSQVTADLLSAEAMIESIKAALESYEADFERLVNMAPPKEMDPLDCSAVEIDKDFDSLWQRTLNENLSLKSEKSKVKASNAELWKTTSNWVIPDIDISYTYTSNPDIMRMEKKHTLHAGLTWTPVSLNRYMDIRTGLYSSRVNKVNYHNTVKELRKDLKASYRSYEHNKVLIQRKEEEVIEKARVAGYMEKSYKSGYDPIREWIKAEARLIDAQIQLLQHKSDFFSIVLKLIVTSDDTSAMDLLMSSPSENLKESSDTVDITESTLESQSTISEDASESASESESESQSTILEDVTESISEISE